ncbi:PR5-like receptor kinase, partial [Vigna unguiculata]|uniref:PR5-like receptor kinase n=1 Tax=Vigna unguiculata TaxID=3917 RepID=UPI0010161B90
STLVVAGAVVLVMVLACCFRTNIISANTLLFPRDPTHQIIEGFLKEHGPLPTARYSYSEVKKMTNFFRNKLGQGGFGSVYKGKLHDRHVAVKILNRSEDNGEEEFINEVASISRTSHVNVVRLLGFCLDKSKRALIYEFMPNGSLDKFIYHDKNSLRVSCQLDYEILYDIAIGIARGLEYLHRGCNTRILHFDIKPHNILLDDEFCPKISDFGLAKLCPRKESAVSIFGARGTAGYIAPEIFSRNFGPVSHKSDVYSYGMMVIEMVGMKHNFKAKVDCSSEIYFPQWIYNFLESEQELSLENMIDESDDKIVRKMSIVGLWCIQTYPSTRPAISRVVEMLESKVELLQIPPKPFLSDPSTSSVNLSGQTL